MKPPKISILIFILSMCVVANAQLKFSFIPTYSSGEGWLLKSSVTNIGDKSVDLKSEALPWSSPWNIATTAFVISFNPKLIPHQNAINDPNFGVTNLKPNDTLTGDMLINYMHPRIDEVINKTPVAFYYKYEVKQLVENSNAIEQNCFFENF